MIGTITVPITASAIVATGEREVPGGPDNGLPQCATRDVPGARSSAPFHTYCHPQCAIGALERVAGFVEELDRSRGADEPWVSA